MDLIILILAGIIVPPMLVTAEIMKITDKIVEVRNWIVNALGLQDFYY